MPTRTVISALVASSLWLAGCAELAYRHMNDPSRDVWQKPKTVIEMLEIAPGSNVADLGAGGGYFTWYLAKAVGPDGMVYAVEINDTALEMLAQARTSRRATNVVPVRASPERANLPEPVDLVFSCDTYHHMDARVEYFRSMAGQLKADGRVAILEFHPHGFFSGLLGHGTAKEVVRREMESAGYRLVSDFDVIDRQHFQVFALRDE
ncbi:hypothetical protein YTPLAS18_31540 [Nitrospira sp.]|nr:hypothetical protein YTPLAS18_31540 [Nitrospira sp.]